MNVIVDYALIGKRIKEYRLNAHMTQAELAEISGVCQQYIGCLERGKGIPSLATVLALCHALSVDPNSLLLNSSIYDPEAACTLRDAPSVYTQTLSALWKDDFPETPPVPWTFDPSLFPALDITLDDEEFPFLSSL